MVMYLVGTLLTRLPSVSCCKRAHRVLTSGNVCTSATPTVFVCYLTEISVEKFVLNTAV
jgi:hypothetical protein